MTFKKGALGILSWVGALAIAGTAHAAGPVRIVRVSYIDGPVDWRPAASVSWSHASRNLPIREGSQIWAPSGGRAEIVFDDGAVLRLGDGGLVTLKTLYSDSSGEYTDISLNQGDATLALRHGYSVYQLDTPYVSVRADNPGKVRVWSGSRAQIFVKSGSFQCQGHRGKVVLNSGQGLDFQPDGTYYPDSNIPSDSWTQFDDDRDRVVERVDPNVPSDIALVSGELTDYGTWRDEPHYGHVWYPHTSGSGWRPYHDGNWVWVDPVGWTWVAAEPWGWAPYHYGTWVDGPGGWGWVPGPQTQYWSPGVVSFTTYNGGIAWAPLAPSEVRYPSELSVGFRSGNWSLFFSIGGCANYYPASASYCQAYPFDGAFINAGGYRGPGYYQHFNAGDYFHAGPRFVPVNSFAVAGGSFMVAAQFGRSGRAQALGRNGGDYFRKGRSYAPTARGGGLRATPMFARPTLASFTPSRSFVRGTVVPHAVASRAVFHAASWTAPAQRADRFAAAGRAAAARTTARTAAGMRAAPGTRAGATRPGATRPGATRPGAAMARTNPRAGSFGKPGAADPRRAAAAKAAANARAAIGFHARPSATKSSAAARRTAAAVAAHRTTPAHATPAARSGAHATTHAARSAAPTRRASSPARSAARTPATHRTTASRTAVHRSAPARSRTPRPAPHRSTPTRSAPQRSAPRRSAPRRSAPQRSAPRPASRAPRSNGGGRPAPNRGGGGGHRDPHHGR